jgi:hypothetical protein
MEVDRTFSHWSIGNPRITWSAVFAGWAVGLALQTVLTLAGLGFGAWAIDLHDANPAQGIPIGAAVWTGLSMLMSAFLGGYLAARLSGSVERSDGVYHGLVVWGVNWLIVVWLTTTAMATMIGGAFSIFGATLRTLEPGLSNAASAAVSRTAGRITLSVDDLRREIESVLGATGKLELEPEAMPPDAGRAGETLRQRGPLGRLTSQSLAELRDSLTVFDRDAAVHLMVNRFGMSDAQAKDVVQSTIGLLGPLKDAPRGVKRSSTALEADALDRLGMVSLWLAGLALISLAVSAVGGMIGAPEHTLIESTTSTESYRDIRRAS